MKRINKYFTQRKQALELLLMEADKTNPPEYFHHLRVEIKKLNALCKLIEYSTPHFKQKRTLEPFKLIMQQAGKLRELQIEESLLKKYSSNVNLRFYNSKLEDNKIIEREQFFNITNASFISQVHDSFSTIKTFLKGIGKKELKAYLRKKRNKINKLLRRNYLPHSSLHELRKRLKVYAYLQKELLSNKYIKSPGNIKKLLSLLGNWHDKQLLINHLKKAINTSEIKPDEKTQLKKIEKILVSANKIEINKIEGLISKF